MENTKKHIVLDVDTGSDDAVAILLAFASDNLVVDGICTVWGNLDVEETTANTIALCNAIGQEVCIYRGSHQAMVKDADPFQSFDNNYKPIVLEDGSTLRIHYDMLEMLPKTDKRPMDLHAVRYYISYLESIEEGANIIATGPLTNLGWVFYLRPDLGEKLSQLYIMGGGIDLTNVTGSAEANIWHDAEALEYILRAGVKPVVATLDATHSAALDLDDARDIEMLNNFSSQFTAKMIQQRIEYESTFFDFSRSWTAIHDAVAVAAFLDDAIIEQSFDANLSVNLEALSYGELLVDWREIPEKSNARILTKINKQKFKTLLIEHFKGVDNGK